MTLTDFSYPV